MKAFIVSAHPEPKSFNTALFDLSVRALKGQGWEVRTSDLYAMAFNPVASAADFTDRVDPDYLVYALEQRHGYESGTLAPDIQDEIEKVQWCDLLILNFPLYWFSVPAILKGWIDRVLISGLTYGGKRFYDRGGLKGRKAMATITLGGREHMLAEDGVHGPLEDMLRPLLRGTLYYTGMSVLPPFVAWHVPYISDAERQDILKAYEERLGRLQDLEPLDFPSLDEFDDTLHPLKG
ncbi:MAG: NAD(P)H-dependent oxidoreductase [Rhodospirillales bacterium]|nr:NAD(P)H-dependent oxidoreductase [Alphaproteobacteria bacterium]MBL6947079.1 NAD(P)H-dependent oxidoreductase [Rhodospirillales bacterium]